MDKREIIINEKFNCNTQINNILGIQFGIEIKIDKLLVNSIVSILCKFLAHVSNEHKKLEFAIIAQILGPKFPVELSQLISAYLPPKYDIEDFGSCTKMTLADSIGKKSIDFQHDSYCDFCINVGQRHDVMS